MIKRGISYNPMGYRLVEGLKPWVVLGRIIYENPMQGLVIYIKYHL